MSDSISPQPPPQAPAADRTALTPTEKLLYTPMEAAGRLSLSRTMVYELMASGRLAYVRIGTARRVPAAALRAFVDRELARQGFLPDAGVTPSCLPRR